MRGRLLSIGVASLLWVSPVRADVQISIANGQVSLTATNATIPEILAEWSLVGGTTIITAEKISGPPLTLQFSNEPEERALKTLLRSAGGFVAAPRPLAAAGA